MAKKKAKILHMELFWKARKKRYKFQNWDGDMNQFVKEAQSWTMYFGQIQKIK